MVKDHEKKCVDRVRPHLTSRLTALRAMWKAYCAGDENGPEEYGPIHEYGLSFDYVAPDTFNKQKEGYWRYQLSWGGPSDEFRFYSSAPNQTPYKIEYWFLDWFDGAHVRLSGQRLTFLTELWCWFAEGGTTQAVYDKAMEE